MCLLFFSKFLFFTKWSPFKNYKRCFLFHLKSSFHSRDIHIFVFLSSPLFLPVSHCFRTWSKISLIVYGVINYLYKNLVTHFVWNLEKDKGYDIETLSINILKKEYFLWNNHTENMHWKLQSVTKYLRLTLVFMWKRTMGKV